MVDLENRGMFGSLMLRLSASEEKLGVLEERLLLLNQTFIAEQDKTNLELSSMKEAMRLIKEDTEKIKSGIGKIIKETSEFARKEELEILERYIKMWDPIKNITKEEK